MSKKIIAVLCAIVLIISAGTLTYVKLTQKVKTISRTSQLEKAFTKDKDVTYILKKDVYPKNFGITTNTIIDGNGFTFISAEEGDGATIYQNENVSSAFSNLKFQGNKKGDVGIWVGTGSMTFTDSAIFDYDIDNVNQSAIGLGNNAVVNLNNTAFYNNNIYDITASSESTINIGEGTTLNNIHIKSSFVKLNIGDNWSDEFEILFDSPAQKKIGTVSDSADISKITVSNEGYYLENDNGSLMLRYDKERAIRFDLSTRDTLYKGSTGFLYGASEINVPSVDLIQGLKPDTMVQKAVGGLQHPTGDAVRTNSALFSAGIKDMQIYFQDMYLEWPYDAPMKDESIDIDGYQKSVEKILYNMICNKSNKAAKGAFLGSDGNYYVLDKKTASQYSYVLFNEPDQIWFGGNLTGLEAAWKQVYQAVHKIDPNARCCGPNYSGFNADDYNHFLKYCLENDCLPEMISWHDLGDISLTEFYDHYDTVEKYAETYYKDAGFKPELIVNEYARHYDMGAPGGLIKWLAMFEDKDISGCLAYWAMANSLNELAADQNSPSSSWWVYHWYAQMTGKQCELTSPDFADTRFYGVASYDDKINMGYVLFGGNEDENGEEVVYLDNISSTELAKENNAVNVKIYAVSFSGQQGANYSPDCIFDGAVKAKKGTLRLEITGTDEMDAFFAVLTKPENDASVTKMKDVTIPTLSYEAENATLLGGATAYLKFGWATFATSGRADVGSINNNGDGVQFNVEVPQDGIYTASLFYSLQSPFVQPDTLEPNADGQNRGIGQTLPYGITVDGEKLDDIYLESTVSWAYKNHCDVDLKLSKGSHEITFTHINGDQGDKGNLQLVAAIDKLDLNKIDDEDTRYDFVIDLTEQTNFMEKGTYKVTAVAPQDGYYNITADGDIKLTKQSIDYAVDAKTYSEISTYDTPVSSTVYLSKGANTIGVTTTATMLYFEYDADKTEKTGITLTADEITIKGNNPTYKVNNYAKSGKVISEIGIGQNPVANDTGKNNYITFSVNAKNAGVYNLAIRYSNDEPAPVMLKADGSTYIHPYNIDLVERYAQIVVNDSEPETVYFRNTLSWDTFKTVDVQLKLKKGQNTFKIYNDNSYQFSSLVNSTAPEIDTITISKLSYDGTAVKKIDK